MPLGIGNHTSKSSVSVAQASVTTPGIAITAGNLIVIGTQCYATPVATNEDAATPITDSAGNTYTKIGSTTIVDNHRYTQLFYANNCLGGASVTFTYTLTGSDYPRIFVLEITGADPTAPLDQSAFAQSGSATTITTAGFATGTANEILVAMGLDSAGTAVSTIADGGCATNSGAWTKIESISDGSTVEGAMGYAIVSATGTYCVTYSQNNGGGTVEVGLASFKIAPAGAIQIPYQPWQQRAPILAQ